MHLSLESKQKVIQHENFANAWKSASAEYFLTSLGPEMASELNRWGRDNDFPDNLPDAIRRATVFLESERNAAKMLEHNTGSKRAFPPRKGKEGRKDGEVALTANTEKHLNECPHCGEMVRHKAEDCFLKPSNVKDSNKGKPTAAAAADAHRRCPEGV